MKVKIDTAVQGDGGNIEGLCEQFLNSSHSSRDLSKL